MKCFHVHYLIRASATEACARQGGWSHHWAERDTAQWRSLQAPRTLRKKEFFLVEGLRRCVLEGDVTKVLEAGATPWGWEGFATRGTEEGRENGQAGELESSQFQLGLIQGHSWWKKMCYSREPVSRSHLTVALRFLVCNTEVPLPLRSHHEWGRGCAMGACGAIVLSVTFLAL